MEISAIRPSVYPGATANSISPQEAAQRRELIQAVKAVNASGALESPNELVFLPSGSHEVIVRLVDRKTGEVKLQVPPEYVLQLAADLKAADLKQNT